MMVNGIAKIRFSNPHKSYWVGGKVSICNGDLGSKSGKLNHARFHFDFPSMIVPDKSYAILTKRNVDGLRR